MEQLHPRIQSQISRDKAIWGVIAIVLLASSIIVYNTSVHHAKNWAFGLGVGATAATGAVLSLFEKQSIPFAAGIVSSIVLVHAVITDTSASPATDTDGRWVGCLLVSIVAAALISLGLRYELRVRMPLLSMGYDHTQAAVRRGIEYGRERLNTIQDAYDHTQAAVKSGISRGRKRLNAIHDAYYRPLS